MAEADWANLGGAALDTANVDRGVTTGVTRPNGGGSFVYGFNTLTTAAGACGKYCDLTNFNPIQPAASAGGGSIRGAIQRALSAGSTGFSPFLFIGLQSATVEAQGYLLGLEDEDPHRIVLVKGALNAGIPSDEVGSQGILLKGNASYSPGTWLHVRLDMIVNLNGDVLLQCFENDLTANAVTSPSWSPIAGATEFVDDALQINSGSAAFTSGYAGFAFATGGNLSRRAYFDHIELSRQLP
jgi:hypothetical protein